MNRRVDLEMSARAAEAVEQVRREAAALALGLAALEFERRAFDAEQLPLPDGLRVSQSEALGNREQYVATMREAARMLRDMAPKAGGT